MTQSLFVTFLFLLPKWCLSWTPRQHFAHATMGLTRSSLLIGEGPPACPGSTSKSSTADHRPGTPSRFRLTCRLCLPSRPTHSRLGQGRADDVAPLARSRPREKDALCHFGLLAGRAWLNGPKNWRVLPNWPFVYAPPSPQPLQWPFLAPSLRPQFRTDETVGMCRAFPNGVARARSYSRRRAFSVFRSSALTALSITE